VRGPLFQRHQSEIRRSITDSEEIEDIEALYSIIVSAREGISDVETNERIALVSLCFLGWPGKAPPYTEDIVQFRRAYRGIADSLTLREDFQARLSRELITAVSPDELRFDDIGGNFNVGGMGLDWSSGTGGSRGVPGGQPEEAKKRELQTH
jgi:hypothetical protein